MPTHTLFPTLIHRGPLGGRDLPRFNQRLLDDAEALRLHDGPGQRWSDVHYVGGYTSYATHDKLHRTLSTFAELERRVTRHARTFAARLSYDLRGRSIEMTDCWVNFMSSQVSHGMHLHPLSFLSGTYYVRTPRGSAGLKFEDPRLSNLMAVPPRRVDAPPAMRSFVTMPVRAGTVTLFESWLRHEVPATRLAGERVSISFNYAWSAKAERRAG